MMNILLVDDDQDDIYLTMRLLAKLGYGDVTVARSGEEALQYLSGSDATGSPALTRKKPDLILLDIRLPGISGLDFLQMTSATRYDLRIPVIAISSSTWQNDVSIAYELGAIAYLVKPISLEKLKDAIDQASDSTELVTFKDVPLSQPFEFQGVTYIKLFDTVAVPLNRNAQAHTFIGREQCHLTCYSRKQ